MPGRENSGSGEAMGRTLGISLAKAKPETVAKKGTRRCFIFGRYASQIRFFTKSKICGLGVRVIQLGRVGGLNHNGSEADMDGVKRSQINADEHGSEINNWCQR